MKRIEKSLTAGVRTYHYDRLSGPQKNIAMIGLTAANAQKRIRVIAKETENVILGMHARQRMVEREIFDVDVFKVLRSGFVDDVPELTDRNEWQCKVTLKIHGRRTAGVVAIILRERKLFVKTVEWEDLS